jgi:hypothetical protein
MEHLRLAAAAALRCERGRSSTLRRPAHKARLAALIAFALAALAAGATFAFAESHSGNGPVQARVYGGGRIPVGSCTDGSTQFCSGVTREFSILAVSDPNEDVTYGTVTIGNIERGGPVYVVHVSCLAVGGNLAEIGGIVVDSADPNQVGDTLHLFVRDSGEPAAAARDGVSPLFVDPPQGKPTCRDLSSDAFGNGYFTLAYGDVAVEDR